MKNLFPILMAISGGVLYHVAQKASWHNAAGIACCLLGLYLLSQK